MLELATLYRVVQDELASVLAQVEAHTGSSVPEFVKDEFDAFVLQLKSPYRDGTTHIVMQLQEFMQRLAALVPRLRLHLIRFHGVLALHAKLRAAIVPDAVQQTSEPAQEHAHGKSARMSWARLLRRVFNIDIERCECDGQLRIIAAIEEPAVIVRILTHLGLAGRAPRRGRWRYSRRPDPRGKDGSAAGPMASLGSRSRAAVKLGQSETIQVDAKGVWSSRAESFPAGNVWLTASWAGDIVADGGKGGLNFLFADVAQRLSAMGHDVRLMAARFVQTYRSSLSGFHAGTLLDAAPRDERQGETHPRAALLGR